MTAAVLPVNSDQFSTSFCSGLLTVTVGGGGSAGVAARLHPDNEIKPTRAGNKLTTRAIPVGCAEFSIDLIILFMPIYFVLSFPGRRTKNAAIGSESFVSHRESGWLICHRVIHRFRPYISVRLKSSMTLCNNSRARNPLMHNQLLLRRLRTYRCAIDRDKILNVPTMVPSLGIFAPGSA